MDADDYEARARERLEDEDLRGALEDLERALELEPDRAHLLGLRDEVRAALEEEPDEADDDSDELDGLSPEALRTIKNPFQGKPSKPVAAQPPLDPGPTLLTPSALLARYLEHPAAARDLVDEAIARAGPDRTTARLLRALLRAHEGDTAGALDDLETAHYQDEEDALAPCFIAGLGGGAEPLARWAHEPRWPAPLARLFLGKIQRRFLVARFPEHACAVRACLGLQAERDGDPATARADYEACLAARQPERPEHLWASLRLRALSR